MLNRHICDYSQVSNIAKYSEEGERFLQSKPIGYVVLQNDYLFMETFVRKAILYAIKNIIDQKTTADSAPPNLKGMYP